MEQPTTPSPWPTEGGETGALVRGFDWSATALGPAHQWSQSLKTSIDLMLPAQAQIVLFWGPEYIAFYNDAYAPTIGGKHPDAMGRPAHESWREMWHDLAPLLARVRETGKTFAARDREFTMDRHGFEEKVYFDLSYSPVRDEAGAVAGVLCIVSETTARVHSERQLVAREAELRKSKDELLETHHQFTLAQKAGGIGVFAMDVATGVLTVSAEFCALFGLPVAETYPGAEIEALALPEDVVRMSSRAQRVAGDAPLNVEYRIRRSDTGELRWIARGAEFVRDARGRTVQMLGTVQDITERKAAEATLREREAQFRVLAQAIPNQVWTAPADGLLDWFNDQVYEYSGLTHAELVGPGWGRIVHPDDLPLVFEQWGQALATGERYEAEFRIRRRDGVYRWHLVRALPAVSEDGATRWVGTNTDIEDHKTAQVQLVQLNATLEERVEERTRDRDRMWRLSTDAMLVARFEGGVHAVNPAWKSLLGWDESELIGRSFFAFVHPDDLKATQAESRRLQAGHTTLRFENRVRHKDGSYRHLAWTAVPDAQFLHAVGRDITAEKAAAAALADSEARLRQSQKMEAVGQLTGGIAHDFNNLLTGIIGSLEIVRRRVAAGRAAEVGRFMDAATASAQRAAALTHRLLAFARRQSLDTRPVDVNALVASMEDLLHRTLGEQVRLDVVLGEATGRALGDENQLESALLNLAINARDAMPQGGRLTITTRHKTLAQSMTRQSEGMVPGEYVAIAVADTGTGMPPDVVAKAFDPFFTTKPVGQGTGLGLSMIYGFVKQSGGHVRIDSEPGQGTTVTLYLPRLAQDAADALGDASVAGASTVAQETPRGAGETVLVVEDDPAVRQLVVEVLHELGYGALEASDGLQALPLLQSTRAIDLLISDVGLPGMNGRQLAEVAREHRPDLRVLFVTGYAETAAVRADFLGPGMQMIAKPFDMDALATKIREMLGRG